MGHDAARVVIVHVSHAHAHSTFHAPQEYQNVYFFSEAIRFVKGWQSIAAKVSLHPIIRIPLAGMNKGTAIVTESTVWAVATRLAGLELVKMPIGRDATRL